MTPKERLKICIIGQLLVLIADIIPTVLLANKNSTYYRFGPNEELIIISIKINTWSRYGILLGYIILYPAVYCIYMVIFGLHCIVLCYV